MPKLYFLPLLLYSSAFVFAQKIPKKIDALIKGYAKDKDFNGTVLVARKSKVIFEKSYGFRDAENQVLNDADGIYQAGSLTKQFTSAVIMQLQQENKLSVSDKLSKYFPGFPDADKITIEHLLTHTSGIYDFGDDPEIQKKDVTVSYNKEELLSLFIKYPLKFEPGTKYHYSNIGYWVLGYIIEQVTHQSFEKTVRERILIPLGMFHSGFDFSNLNHESKVKGYTTLKGSKPVPSIIVDSTVSFASGALYSTARDLYKWGEATYSVKILTEDSWKAIFTPYKNKYGYGWGSDTFFNKVGHGHGGNIPGFSSYFLRIPEDKVMIILLDNSSSSALPKMAKSIAAILYEQPYEVPNDKKASITIDSILLQKYVGEYQASASLSITIALENNQLKAKPTGRGFYEIYPESEKIFKLKIIEAKIEFVTDDKGNVIELIFHRGSGQIRGKKIK